MSKRDAYIAKIKLQLDQLNAKMKQLEAKTNEVKADAQEQYKQEMNLLRRQSRLATAKLEELKAATEATWERMVAEMEKVSDAFTHAFHYFRSQL